VVHIGEVIVPWLDADVDETVETLAFWYPLRASLHDVTSILEVSLLGTYNWAVSRSYSISKRFRAMSRPQAASTS